jgi:hypothetical protein
MIRTWWSVLGGAVGPVPLMAAGWNGGRSPPAGPWPAVPYLQPRWPRTARRQEVLQRFTQASGARVTGLGHGDLPQKLKVEVRAGRPRLTSSPRTTWRSVLVDEDLVEMCPTCRSRTESSAP